MKEGRFNREADEPQGISKVFDELSQADALSKEFHLEFPQSSIDTIVGAERGSTEVNKWKVIFTGDLTQDKKITAWLKKRGVIK